MAADSRLADLSDGEVLRLWCPFHNNVMLLMKVFMGNLVAGFPIPKSPALVFQVTRPPKSEAKGRLQVPFSATMDFHASIAAELTARRFIDGRPVSLTRSEMKMEGEFVLFKSNQIIIFSSDNCHTSTVDCTNNTKQYFVNINITTTKLLETI